MQLQKNEGLHWLWRPSYAIQAFRIDIPPILVSVRESTEKYVYVLRYFQSTKLCDKKKWQRTI